MKNMFNYKSLIKVAIMIVVIALIGSQLMDTDAGRKRRPDDNNTSGGGQNENGNGNGNGNQNGGTAECPTCCDAWDKLLTTDRFKLVMNDEAVLDHETCLVWEQSPDTTTRTWTSALSHCFTKKVGDRKGWRAPTIEELATIVDDTQAAPTIPAELKTLTSDVRSSFYWSSTTNADNTTNAWSVDFILGNVFNFFKTDLHYVWCVRGGQGHDAY
jgi:hypothetical protein